MNIDNKKIIGWVKQSVLFICLVTVAALSRYFLLSADIQPFPNFELITVTALLAIMFIRPAAALLVPLLGMIISDVMVGNPVFTGANMNQIVIFTYSGFALISLLIIFNRKKIKQVFSKISLPGAGIATGMGILLVLTYDVWTNLGWWYLLYPHTPTALATVFTMGIPFMLYHALSGALTFALIAYPIMVFTSQKEILPNIVTTKTMQKVAVGAVVGGLMVLSFAGTATQINENSDIWLDQADTTSVKITILGDEWKIEDNIIAQRDSTVYSLLKRCSTQNGFSVESTYYEEYDSRLLTSIKGDINGENGNYWQYFVNGELPELGCDKYHVSNGDHIAWKFEQY